MPKLMPCVSVSLEPQEPHKFDGNLFADPEESNLGEEIDSTPLINSDKVNLKSTIETRDGDGGGDGAQVDGHKSVSIKV